MNGWLDVFVFVFLFLLLCFLGLPFFANTNTYANSTQSTSKVKAGQLWPKSKDELLKQLTELKTELGQLRIQKITSSGSKLNRM